jgi:peptidylprolyl isomerase
MRRIAAAAVISLCLDAAAMAQAPPLDPLLEAEDQRRPQDPALSEAAVSEQPGRRVLAARAWGRIQRPGSIDPLLRLLEDPPVRAEAIFALGQLGWVADAASGREKEILGRLTPMLKDPDVETRTLVVEAVGKLGLDATPGLVTPMLADPAAPVRAEAALALFRHRLVLRLRSAADPPLALPDLPEDSLRALLGLRSDIDPAVRRNVAYYFARVKDARGLEAAVELARDADAEVRLFAVLALGRAEDPRGAAAAAEACRDADERVRIAAVQALTAMRQGSQAPAELARDPSPHVRAALAVAYGGGEKPDGSALQDLWKDGASAEVRAAALAALARPGGSGAADLIRVALEEPSPVVREAAVAAAAGLGKDGQTLLQRALEDRDELVRAAAIEALAAVETAEGLEAVRRGLAAEGVAERGTAVEALARRNETEAPDLAWKTYLACSDRKWVEVRESLIEVIAKGSGSDAEVRLRQALKDVAPSVAAKARAALQARGVTELPEIPAMDTTASPYRALRFEANPVVVLETTKGSIVVECLAAEAPIHVANFVGLVQKGFYDGLLWHRVVPNFVVQGGDPLGTGWGDAGWAVRAEINRVRFERGVLGMPRSQGFDTGSCQLFFTLVRTPHLDGQYTVFGKVREGMQALDRIERGDRILKASVRR